MINEGIKEHFTKILDKGIRYDQRALDEYRKPVTVEPGFIKSAEGSAKVTIGGTVVIAGVKMDVSTPYPDTPDRGSIIVGAELLPLSNPEFESGPPGIQAVELARVVDRGIRESGALDFKAMCITPGEKVWTAIIDICTINDEGNLFDASALAALAAIKNTRLPALTEKGQIDYKKKSDKMLPVTDDTLSVTVLKIGSNFIVDPTTEEEKAMDARLSVALKSDGTLCAMQKGGDMALSDEDILKMVDIASVKVNELRGAL